MLDSLKHYITQQLLAPAQSSVKVQHLTVGLEHEFFLLRDGKPCSHGASQAFLSKLATIPGWHIQSVSEDAQFGKMIDRVSLDGNSGRFTAVKYDHHPHLLEVAFAYQNTAVELLELVTHTLLTLNQVAHSQGLAISTESVLDVRADDPSVVSPLSFFRNLRHYRSMLVHGNGPKEFRAAQGFENYAAVIAATQTHVGGIDWWKRPNLLNQLYSVEPLILPWAALQCSDGFASAFQLLAKRWEGYRAVFAGFPLVGFPDLPSWSIDAWAEALLRSPVCGTTADWYSSKTLAQIGLNPFNDWKAFFTEVRDLQIIRPRFFGTLEFRSDPSQLDAQAICGLAALRLGLCSFFMGGGRELSDFGSARKRWWDLIDRGFQSADESVLENAKEGLASRGYGEEILLSGLLDAAGKRGEATA